MIKNNQNTIIPDKLKDQFFLNDPSVLDQIVEFAQLNTNDVVLEIGAGNGNLTRKIAQKAGRVIAFEIDERYKPILSDLPGNVDLRFESAWDYVQLHGKFRKKKEYNKIVSNLPYSFCEPFFHNLTFLEYDKAILLVPISISRLIETHAVFSSFFRSVEIVNVPSSKFTPKPKTGSVVIDLQKLPDPVQTKNLSLFLRQYIYQREDQKVKNSLREGLIDYANLALNRKLSKKNAEEIIEKSQLSSSLLDSTPNNSEIYYEISVKFSIFRDQSLK